MDKRLVLRTLGAAVAVGVVLGASPSIFAATADFKRGLMGEAPTQLSAEAATPTLQRPLSAEEQKELMQGLLYVLKDQYADAARVLGKYAMLGEPNAQMQVGALYYFGKGVPRDRDEGMRWLRLAASQGLGGTQEMLSAALDGTWTWDDTGEPRHGYSTDLPGLGGAASTSQQYWATGTSNTGGEGPAMSPPQPYSYNGAVMHPGVDDLHSRVEQELNEPSRMSAGGYSDRSTLQVQSSRGTIMLSPAAPGGVYGGSDGRTYIDQGDGVSDAQTGQFIPK